VIHPANMQKLQQASTWHTILWQIVTRAAEYWILKNLIAV